MRPRRGPAARGRRDDILPTLHGETTYIGGGCVTFLAVVLVAVVCLVWDKHKGRPLVLKGCALFCSAVIALVLLFMYNIDPRHMMLLAILLLGAVVVEDAAPAAVWLPVLVVLLLPMNFQRGSLPEKNAEMAAQMQTVEAALTASVQDAWADPWDHTLAYAYDDGVFHGYLYAVPDGMGIEFDKNSYLWDEEKPDLFPLCHVRPRHPRCRPSAGRELAAGRLHRGSGDL